MDAHALQLSALVRAALIVADLERARGFYSEVLGLSRVYWQGTLKGTSLERLLGVQAGSVCRAVILAPDATCMGMVGLFEIGNPTPTPIVRAAATSQPGEAILVFYASDLDVVVARAGAHGGTVFCPPIPLEHDGRVKQREMTLADPDGVKINLIEWDPQAATRPELTPGVSPQD